MPSNSETAMLALARRLFHTLMSRWRRDAEELDGINADEHLADRARDAVPRLWR